MVNTYLGMPTYLSKSRSGLDPDMVIANEDGMEVDEVFVNLCHRRSFVMV